MCRLWVFVFSPSLIKQLLNSLVIGIISWSLFGQTLGQKTISWLARLRLLATCGITTNSRTPGRRETVGKLHGIKSSSPVELEVLRRTKAYIGMSLVTQTDPFYGLCRKPLMCYLSRQANNGHWDPGENVSGNISGHSKFMCHERWCLLQESLASSITVMQWQVSTTQVFETGIKAIRFKSFLLMTMSMQLELPFEENSLMLSLHSRGLVFCRPNGIMLNAATIILNSLCSYLTMNWLSLILFTADSIDFVRIRHTQCRTV